MPFKPGQSGNPGGRPKVNKELVDLCRVHTVAAVNGLISLARSKKTPPAARVAAWREILDRGHGKAPIVMAGEGGVGPSTLVIRWATAAAETAQEASADGQEG